MNPLIIVAGIICGLLILAIGYWLGYWYGKEEGRQIQVALDLNTMADMSEELHRCRDTIAMQDTAIDTLRDDPPVAFVANGYATMGGKVIDLLSHRKGDC
jgi:hypothetical protein